MPVLNLETKVVTCQNLSTLILLAGESNEVLYVYLDQILPFRVNFKTNTNYTACATSLKISL